MEKSKFLNINSIIALLLCLISIKEINAQVIYQFNGQELELYVEEDGELRLLSERSQKTYRFFLAKKNKVVELTEENYIATLAQFTDGTQLHEKNVNYDIRSLAQFVQKFNARNLEGQNSSTLDWRLGVWSGLSNFTNYQNVSNTNAAFTGVEFELFNTMSYTRNSLLTQVRGTFPVNEDTGLAFLELMLGYRFKFIEKNKFHLYLDSELITFGRYKETFSIENLNNETVETTQTNTSLSTPIGLGMGAAVFVTNRFLVTLSYSNIVRLGENTRSDFPIDFRLGLKFGF